MHRNKLKLKFLVEIFQLVMLQNRKTNIFIACKEILGIKGGGVKKNHIGSQRDEFPNSWLQRMKNKSDGMVNIAARLCISFVAVTVIYVSEAGWLDLHW